MANSKKGESAIAAVQPMATQRSSADFMELPPELRVQVYECIFDEALRPARISAMAQPVVESKLYEARVKVIVQHPLLRVNGLVRREALPVCIQHIRQHILHSPRRRDAIDASRMASRERSASFSDRPRVLLALVRDAVDSLKEREELQRWLIVYRTAEGSLMEGILKQDDESAAAASGEEDDSRIAEELAKLWS